MIKHFDLEYKEQLYVDLYLPERESFDLFVYFHGGGLTSGSRKDTVHRFAPMLEERGIAVASVEYRMYPDAKFPDFIEDCASAVRWLKDHISEWGTCRRTFVGGSSAGGYISMMLCFDERYFRAVGMDPNEIDGYIHDAGQPTSHFNVLRELGRDHRRVIVDETAPLYFVGLRESYPPMLFLVADNDMFGRYEQTKLMLRTLAHFGHKENIFLHEMHGTHCCYLRENDENGANLFGLRVLDFIERITP